MNYAIMLKLRANPALYKCDQNTGGFMKNGNELDQALSSVVLTSEQRKRENFLRQLSQAKPHHKDPPMRLSLILLVVFISGFAGLWSTIGLLGQIRSGHQWPIEDFLFVALCDGVFVIFTYVLFTRNKVKN